MTTTATRRCPKCSSTDLERIPSGKPRSWLCLGCMTATDCTAEEHTAESRHAAERDAFDRIHLRARKDLDQ